MQTHCGVVRQRLEIINLSSLVGIILISSVSSTEGRFQYLLLCSLMPPARSFPFLSSRWHWLQSRPRSHGLRPVQPGGRRPVQHSQLRGRGCKVASSPPLRLLLYSSSPPLLFFSSSTPPLLLLASSSPRLLHRHKQCRPQPNLCFPSKKIQPFSPCRTRGSVSVKLKSFAEKEGRKKSTHDFTLGFSRTDGRSRLFFFPVRVTFLTAGPTALTPAHARCFYLF